MPFQPPTPTLSHCKNLILVCCHAIYLGEPSNDPNLEFNWHLQPFQSSSPAHGTPGEHLTFLTHLTTALSHFTRGDWARDSIVVLSGGATAPRITALSEARSYLNAALDLGAPYEGVARAMRAEGRLVLEECATDSLQNLLFGLVAFWRATGRWPERVRVVTHAFKSGRFLELHAPAIKFPAHRITVLGINPPMTLPQQSLILAGEAANGAQPFLNDPYGARPPLSTKRAARGWTMRALEELEDKVEDDGVKWLLRWEGGVTGSELFAEKLPWEESI